MAAKMKLFVDDRRIRNVNERAVKLRRAIRGKLQFLRGGEHKHIVKGRGISDKSSSPKGDNTEEYVVGKVEHLRTRESHRSSMGSE